MSLIQPAVETPDPCESPRGRTVAALWEQLQQVRVIHVRGTPTSGKSSLARNLKFYVMRTEPGVRICSFRWPDDSAWPDGLNRASQYHRLLNFITGRPAESDNWPQMENTLLIIDEAQMSYEYLDLWNDFLKPLASDAKRGPFVILFSSYGSPTQIPVRAALGSAPIHLSAKQRVSIRPLSENNPKISLYFTRSEFDDVVTRVCEYNAKDEQPFLPSSELLEYVWEFTNGHPGATRAVLDALIHSQVSFFNPLVCHLRF
jgi:hypothetical protein